MPSPRNRTGAATGVVFGLLAGSAYITLVEYTGGEGGPAYWFGPPLLGLLCGALHRDGGLLPMVAAFYVSGMVWLGVFGHLNLLPFAMAFFFVPTGLFGIAAATTRALLRKLAGPDRAT